MTKHVPRHVRARLLYAIGFAILINGTGAAAEFDDTRYRAPNGELIEKGMSKAGVIKALNKPAERDIVVRKPGKGPKVEIWTYHFYGDTLILTISGGQVARVKLLQD